MLVDEEEEIAQEVGGVHQGLDARQEVIRINRIRSLVVECRQRLALRVLLHSAGREVIRET